jgi:hypothetical protein
MIVTNPMPIWSALATVPDATRVRCSDIPEVFESGPCLIVEVCL